MEVEGEEIEEVAIIFGAGVIDVRGAGDRYGPALSASFLYLGGKPARLDTPDFHGSIGRLVARVNHCPPRPVELRALLALRDLTVTGETDRALAEVLRPLLQLFSNGRYELRGPHPIVPRCPGPGNPRRWLVINAERDLPARLYPDDYDFLVPTEEWPPADTARVDHYRDTIRIGLRPAVIALRAGRNNRYSGFVLDGHHKLAAYQAEGIAPTAVRIARIDPSPVTSMEVQQAFAEQADTLGELHGWIDVLERA